MTRKPAEQVQVASHMLDSPQQSESAVADLQGGPRQSRHGGGGRVRAAIRGERLAWLVAQRSLLVPPFPQQRP